MCSGRTFFRIITLITFILVIVVTVRVSRDPEPPLVMLSCLNGWVGYEEKCYYFSEAKGNWTYSQSLCSDQGTSLAVIDSLQELTFLMRHKGPNSHWIGLRREGGQPWKYVNGTEFNNLFPVTGGADCAYLNDVGVSSSTCLTAKNWICSKPSLT